MELEMEMAHTIISISSSSSSSANEDDDNQHQSQSESEFEISSNEDDDDDDGEDDDNDEWSGDDDDDDYDEGESDGQGYEGGDEEHSDKHHLPSGDDDRVYDRVSRLAKERSGHEQLNLSECKSYLRRHGLRLTGTKAECIERINEHRRIKDGSGEALYPKLSFSINCTGDVCKGDVVLFTQKVYDKFDKMTRNGGLVGKRTVAGRIVKESYGAAKQQHTFTVEVLWSKGTKRLPPLFPLLVKGRNLYKLRTFRQRWKSEAERVTVLAEKHRRGTAARQTRAMRKTKHGPKHQKLSHAMPKKKTTKQDRENYAGRRRNGPVKNMKSNNPLQSPNPLNLTRTNKARRPAFQSNTYSSRREYHHSPAEYHHQTASQGFTSRDATLSTVRFSHPGDYSNTYRDSAAEYHHQTASQGFTSREATPSTVRFSHPGYYSNSYRNSASEGFNRGAHLHHGSSHATCDTVQRNFNQHPRVMNPYQPVHPYNSRAEEYESRKYTY